MCDKCKPTDKTPYCSIQSRLDRAGVKTIASKTGNYKDVILEYNNERIFRPNTIDCVSVVKKAFGVDI